MFVIKHKNTGLFLSTALLGITLSHLHNATTFDVKDEAQAEFCWCLQNERDLPTGDYEIVSKAEERERANAALSGERENRRNARLVALFGEGINDSAA